MITTYKPELPDWPEYKRVMAKQLRKRWCKEKGVKRTTPPRETASENWKPKHPRFAVGPQVGWGRFKSWTYLQVASLPEGVAWMKWAISSAYVRERQDLYRPLRDALLVVLQREQDLERFGDLA